MADQDWMDELTGQEHDDTGHEDESSQENESGQDQQTDDKARDQADDKSQDQQRMVSLEALHEARAQNRQLREQMQSIEQQNNQLQEVLKGFKDELEQIRNSRREPPPEQPQWDENPRAYVDSRDQATQHELQEIRRKLQENEELTAREREIREQADTQNQQMRALQNAIGADHEQFVKGHPDYIEALEYAREVRRGELEDMGFSGEKLRDIMNREELALAATALQNERSPAEVAYNRAKRWGYQPKSADAGKGDESGGEGPTDDERENAQGMGGSGGPSVQDLLDAEDDEFDAFWRDLGYGEKMK